MSNVKAGGEGGGGIIKTFGEGQCREVRIYKSLKIQASTACLIDWCPTSIHFYY